MVGVYPADVLAVVVFPWYIATKVVFVEIYTSVMLANERTLLSGASDSVS